MHTGPLNLESKLKELKGPLYEIDGEYSLPRLVTSALLRARQTGMLIQAAVLCPTVEPDKNLNEGYPASPVDSYAYHPSHVWRDSARIEAAYREYFTRSLRGPVALSTD